MGVSTLLHAIYEQATQSPNRLAVLCYESEGVRQVNYCELQAQTVQWAQRWASLKLPAKSVVFIILRHRLELYTVFLGAMRAGLVPSFLPFHSSKQDSTAYWQAHKSLFEHVQPSAIISFSSEIESLKNATEGLDAKIIEIETLGAQDFNSLELPSLSEFKNDDPALLQQSSGATGLKKGVLLRFGQIADQVKSYASTLNIGPHDKIASCLPLYHNMGLISSFLLPFSLGIGVISLDTFSWLTKPLSLLDAINKHSCTLTWLPNFAFARLANAKTQGYVNDLTSMKAFISCSEPCKLETFELFYDAFAPCGVHKGMLQTCYAMAETVFAVSQSPLDKSVNIATLDLNSFTKHAAVKLVKAGAPNSLRFLSCGPIMDSLKVSLKYDWKPNLALGKSIPIGEVLIESDLLFDGYYKNTEATILALNNGIYATGDMGFILDNELYICGRLKEIIIVQGKNFYCNDLESEISLIEGIIPERVIVFGEYNNQSASEEAIVIIETDKADKADQLKLKRLVSERISKNFDLVLSHIEFVPRGWLSKDTSGKISRSRNLEKYRKFNKVNTR